MDHYIVPATGLCLNCRLHTDQLKKSTHCSAFDEPPMSTEEFLEEKKRLDQRAFVWTKASLDKPSDHIAKLAQRARLDAHEWASLRPEVRYADSSAS